MSFTEGELIFEQGAWRDSRCDSLSLECGRSLEIVLAGEAGDSFYILVEGQADQGLATSCLL